jgi:hypothetical protein
MELFLFIIFSLPFGGALVVRLTGARRRELWAAWAASGLAAFFAAWLGGGLTASAAALAASAASAAGFLGPELWEGARGLLRALFEAFASAARELVRWLLRPRHLLLAAAAGIAWLALRDPVLQGELLRLATSLGALALAAWGLRLIVTAPFRGRGRSRR